MPAAFYSSLKLPKDLQKWSFLGQKIKRVAYLRRVVAAWSGSSGTTHRLLLHHPLLEQLTVRLLLLELFDGSCLIYER